MIPAAYVYVSSNPGGSHYQINAYEAALSGRLGRIPGSPFVTDIYFLAVNGKYLFGTNYLNIESFSIAPNGAIQQVATVGAGTPGGGPGALFLDHSGTTLYTDDINAQGTDNNGYQSFSIDSSTGALTYLGEDGSSPTFGSTLSFVSDNLHAYSSSCYHFTPMVFGFTRTENGALDYVQATNPIPNPGNGNFYCPGLAAADTAEHLAVSLQPLDGSTWQPIGPSQIAVYTADASGNLTTTSTPANMPSVSVGGVVNYWMSPSGNLLAVAGTGGLEVFHFNGANPVTEDTGLLTTDRVDRVLWDDSNHLYAISRSAGKLYVFTVTPTSAAPAAGSPYAIKNPVDLIVLPKR